MEHLNIGFLLFVLSEQSESKELDSRSIRSSMDRWWANCIRNQRAREWIGEQIRKVRSGSTGYAFTRQMYRDALEEKPFAREVELE